MTALRYGLLLAFLFTFLAHSDEGPGMCPHGGKGQALTAGDDGRGIDPNGGSRLNGDKGLGVDPNGGPHQ
jgi:hypothetical protein